MKKWICLCLACVSLLSMLAGCSEKPQTQDPTVATEDPVPVQSPEEAAVFKVLMIGQSHAQDSVWLLYEVLKAEMPDKEFVVVDLYQPLTIGEHVQNIKTYNGVYDYCENRNGKVVTTPNFRIDEALMKEQWDLIAFNEATFPQTSEAEFTDGDMQFLQDFIAETATPGYKLAYNATWAQPVSKVVYTSDRRQPPENFRENFAQRSDADRLKHFSQICHNIETYVETDEDYDLVFHSGTAIQYASETLGVPEGDPLRTMDLYRDYTHLSDFGRLMVAYLWYAQIYGIEELTEINVDVIPAHMRATDKEQLFGDLTITEEHKQIIIESVNYALKNPNVAPPQVARESAILEPLN